MLERLYNSDSRHVVIDLHGCSVADTKQYLERQLKNVSCSNLTELYLITGWGKHTNSQGTRGVLKKILPALLKTYQLEIAKIIKEKGAYKIILKNYVRTQSLSQHFFESLVQGVIGRDIIDELKSYETKGKQGDVEALLLVAYTHLHYNIPGYCNKSYGLKLLEQAKAQGSLEACISLGELYLKGVEIKHDTKKAFHYFKEVAEKGDAFGQYRLATCYLSGQGVKRDDKEGYHWLKKAADAGLPYAQYTLAESYFKGDFTEQDYDISLDYMRRAAHQSLAAAQVHLGRCYGAGCYGIEQDYWQAFQYYWLAAQADDVFAIYQVAKYFAEGRLGETDAVKAFDWFLKGAKLGDVDCQAAVAISYFLGRGTNRNIQESMAWCQKALEKGCEAADWLMSQAYRDGKGVQQDFDKYYAYLVKAANKGYEMAQIELTRLSTYISDSDNNLQNYVDAEKTKVENTVLIRLLNEKTSLTFFGLCDKNYQVDAVADTSTVMSEKKAKELQCKLGCGQFFTLHNKKHFVLDGINLPGDNAIGNRIQNYFKQN